MGNADKVKTIAVLTGGGDAPGLNAVIRAVVRTALGQGLKVWGIKNGFGGMVENQLVELTNDSVAGILPRGGTILGTTNRDNPFHYPVVRDGQVIYEDLSGQALANLRQAGIEALVVIGGDGSLKIASEFYQLGLPVVAVPKTIDNDIPGTERTFGFDTAVGVAAEALDRLHTTAESHHRVMVLEVMGRYAGWIALHAGMAGGADCILLPEIPFSIDSVIAKIKERQQHGRQFSLIVIAEGAYPQGGEVSVSRIVEGSHEKIRLGGAGEKLARAIEQLTGVESRCTVLGHVQRGGTPTAFDRILSTRYGVAAAECVLEGAFGNMVALQKDRIIRRPIDDIAGKANNITADNELLRAGRSIGICFGD
ncbi:MULTISPECIES: 6-phosphofructokinase [Sporomusa]|jgi:phosphofructokinase-like protein|uniref:ATP-dependent 6-phosphofructokinase n=2 Tax=Sporomusa TaxID=2375 RepID=A0ABM9W7S2_9FIRM|nr:ATP-dependent 6-phosphofructokinase [Sporomusa sphaeroides]MCM0760505.1 6-phosphofructokinase [Sporomusa sphaeroides DSM 2875]OLS56912.1 6-phosphofructokinase 1 [Sporomusa sphaeroides DSM 2875]CVK21180.1 6-phosphofructokinase 1 [Sporomusa sphaeroides DSM 2875]SCM81808.1 6-phosphofructokinase 2 [uncultured Sporomusa sp.]HML32095.1 ATP-dependent 6-phosphofructokinase [Sporomusa sphaeroides]